MNKNMFAKNPKDLIMGMELLYSIHRFVFEFDRLADVSLQDNLEITVSQFMIMMGISSCPNSTQKDISVYLNLTEAAVSRQVQNLTEKNYVLRVENPQNRREHIILLTKQGDDELSNAYTFLNDIFEEKLKIISQKNRKSIISSIQKLFEK